MNAYAAPKPIARAWASYEKAFLTNLPVKARRPIKRAFFAGAGGMFQYIEMSLSAKGMTEELHAFMMRQIDVETKEFAADMKAGKE